MFTLRRAITVAVLAVPASWLIACATADPGPDSGASDLSAGSSSASKTAAKSKDAGSEAAAPRPSGVTCQAKPSEDACFACCFNNGTATAPSDRAYATCATNAAQKCGSACVASIAVPDGGASAAAIPVDDFDFDAPDPCAACEDDFSACSDLADKACAADPTCAAATKCYADAKCSAKGDSDGEGGTTTDYASSGGTSSGGF